MQGPVTVFDGLANISQRIGLLGRIRHEDGKITVIGVEVRGRAPVGFGKVVVAREEVTALLLLHLDDGALHLRQEIEDLGRLRRPFLVAHPLVEDDLLFVLE